jgi:hypothetical protein
MSNKTSMQAVSGYQSTTARSSVLRRSAAAVVGFVAGVIGIFAIAPAAFAMRVPPPDGGGLGTSTDAHGLIQSANAAAQSINPAATAVTSAHGMGAWEITLIVAAAVVVVSLLAFVAVKVRSSVTRLGGAPA